MEVYFDDFTITQVKSPVVEITDYYPFGLVAQNFQRESEVPQNFKYNGKEQINDLGLDWADYGARMYMPEIGRWGVVDPLAQLSRRWSPYTYAYDNPIRFIDPDGMYSTDEWMKDHGLTQDDVVTIYQAPKENEEQEPDEGSGGPTPAPSNVLGTPGYYSWRVGDFNNRHKGSSSKAPSYYMQYGDKNAYKFASSTFATLSSSGKVWLMKAMLNLQVAIETELQNNPGIEENDGAFTKFAFESHVDAYVDAGFLKLSVLDKVKIGLTPDPSDLINGADQMVDMGNRQLNYYRENPGFAAQQAAEFIIMKPVIEKLIVEYAIKHGLDPTTVKNVVNNVLPK